MNYLRILAAIFALFFAGPAIAAGTDRAPQTDVTANDRRMSTIVGLINGTAVKIDKSIIGCTDQENTREMLRKPPEYAEEMLQEKSKTGECGRFGGVTVQVFEYVGMVASYELGQICLVHLGYTKDETETDPKKLNKLYGWIILHPSTVRHICAAGRKTPAGLLLEK